MLCIAYVNFINNLLCSLSYFRMEKITIKSPSGVYREEKVAYTVKKKKSARFPVGYGKLVVTF